MVTAGASSSCRLLLLFWIMSGEFEMLTGCCCGLREGVPPIPSTWEDDDDDDAVVVVPVPDPKQCFFGTLALRVLHECFFVTLVL